MNGKFGPYTLKGELGKGGMGVVYRAFDEERGRDVALKTLGITGPGDEEFRSRFAREAEVLRRLRHPNIAAVHDAGVIEGKPFIAMQLIEGKTLKAALAAGLELRAAVAVVRDVARAIEHAHERGILHRDLKPENVLLDQEGKPYVVDFGLARIPGATMTGAGQVLGTPAYMSPEQADGSRVDERADVYQLGALLYFVLCGRPPFEGKTSVNIISAVLTKPPVPPRSHDPEAPAELERICLRCLEKLPDRRYARAAEVAVELERYLHASSRARWVRPAAVGAILGLAALAVGLELAARAKGHPERPGHRHEPMDRRPPPDRASAPAESSARAGELVALSEERIRACDLERGIATATKAIELDPRLARGWMIRGVARGSKGDWDGEIADETRAIELDPNLALAWANRGNAQGNKGDWDGAIADETRAIELDPGLAWAWSNRGTLRRRKGDCDGAIADETRAIELDPTLAVAWLNRGYARGQNGDWDGAIADETRAIELDPTLADAWSNRGQARGNKGDWDGEIADETRAIELDSKLSPAWFYLGTARGNKGDFDGEIAAETRAIELDPTFADAWANRGTAYFNKGDLQGAITDLERSLKLRPNGPNAEATRRNLEIVRTRAR